MKEMLRLRMDVERSHFPRAVDGVESHRFERTSFLCGTVQFSADVNNHDDT